MAFPPHLASRLIPSMLNPSPLAPPKLSALASLWTNQSESLTEPCSPYPIRTYLALRLAKASGLCRPLPAEASMAPARKSTESLAAWVPPPGPPLEPLVSPAASLPLNGFRLPASADEASSALETVVWMETAWEVPGSVVVVE